MKISFMVGEMAKLHGISKQTLQYYDRIDLLKPKEIGGDNQYRYYTLDQFEQLDTILSLKDLGMKLSEIKHYLTISSVEERIQQLESQQWAIQQRISQLERTSRVLHSTTHSLKESLEIIPFEMGIKTLDKRYIKIEPVQPPYDWYQFEIAIKKAITLYQHEESIPYNYLMVFVGVNDTKYECFKKIALELSRESEECLPAGNYAYLYHKGSYADLDRSWKMLLDFIEESGLEICGECIEKALLNNFAVSNYDDILLELQVQIRER